MKFLKLVFSIIFIFNSSRALACASCGCNVDSDVDSQKILPAKAADSWRFDLRYDHLNQDQLRSGANPVSASKAAAMQDFTQEVEKYTVNDYLTLSTQYDAVAWAARLIIPMIQRGHGTNGNGAGDATWDGLAPNAGGGAYTSNATGLGDLRILGIAKNILSFSQLNLSVGLKLPTGRTHQTGTSTDGTAPGSVPVDPGLQLGTGTTDLIYGLDDSLTINEKWTGFAQIQFQTALQSVNNYRPGDSYNFNLGARYYGFREFTPLIQLNTHWVITDGGAAADRLSTGGTLVYVTPGLAETLTDSLVIYEMLQVPIYQYVEGAQLTPQSIFSFGLQYAI